jgi:hypothetical protein
MNTVKNPSPTASLMESNPQEAWELLAKLEFEGPGGMTGLPVLRPTLSEKDRQTLKVRQTEANIRKMVATGMSGKKISEKLGISLPSIYAIKRKLSSHQAKRQLAKFHG